MTNEQFEFIKRLSKRIEALERPKRDVKDDGGATVPIKQFKTGERITPVPLSFIDVEWRYPRDMAMMPPEVLCLKRNNFEKDLMAVMRKHFVTRIFVYDNAETRIKKGK